MHKLKIKFTKFHVSYFIPYKKVSGKHLSFALVGNVKTDYETTVCPVIIINVVIRKSARDVTFLEVLNYKKRSKLQVKSVLVLCFNGRSLMSDFLRSPS